MSSDSAKECRFVTFTVHNSVIWVERRVKMSAYRATWADMMEMEGHLRWAINLFVFSPSRAKPRRRRVSLGTCSEHSWTHTCKQRVRFTKSRSNPHDISGNVPESCTADLKNTHKCIAHDFSPPCYCKRCMLLCPQKKKNTNTWWQSVIVLCFECSAVMKSLLMECFSVRDVSRICAEQVTESFNCVSPPPPPHSWFS